MTFNKMTIRDVPLENKVVLVRADYNVPLTSDRKISDDLRIRASLPTLRFLIKQKCKIVVMSHLGRPDGKRNSEYSLEPVAERLKELLGRDVTFIEEDYGDKVKQAVKHAKPGDVLLLENLRFHPGEEANDLEFAHKIIASTGARYLVQDGFGVVHRAHASTSAIAQAIPSVAGFLLETEIDTITRAMQSPKRPMVAIMGGAKVSDKIKVIEAFVNVADKILVGGAMANTFLAYKGYNMGKSMVESDQTATLDKIYAAAKQKLGNDSVDEFILLPSDAAVTKEINDKAARRVVDVSSLASDDIAVDIGDATIERYAKELSSVHTAVWNGTMGLAEYQEFAHGSARVALSLAANPSVLSIIGGGDTADFVLKWDGDGGASFTHVSTGGGASLDLMAGKALPGVDVLLDAKK